MSDLDYKAVLDDLRERRQKIDMAIDAIEDIMGHTSGESPVEGRRSAPTGGSGEIRSDAFFQMTLGDAVKKYLGIIKRPRKAAQIAKALEDGGVMSQAKNFYANVSTALRRLKEAGDVVQIPDTKEWAMARWYPTRPKPNNTQHTETAVDEPGSTGGDTQNDTPTMTMKVL